MQSSEGSIQAAEPGAVPVEPVEEPSMEPAPAEGGHGAAGHGDIHLPPPTIWPVTTAGGITLAGLGLVTTYAISFLGLLIMFYGLFSWIQELRHEHD